jgi:hypothetical protein
MLTSFVVVVEVANSAAQHGVTTNRNGVYFEPSHILESDEWLNGYTTELQQGRHALLHALNNIVCSRALGSKIQRASDGLPELTNWVARIAQERSRGKRGLTWVVGRNRDLLVR